MVLDIHCLNDKLLFDKNGIFYRVTTSRDIKEHDNVIKVLVIVKRMKTT